MSSVGCPLASETWASWCLHNSSRLRLILSVSLCWSDATEQGILSDFFLIDDSSNCNRRWIHSLKEGSSSGILQILTHFRLNIITTSIGLLLLFARRCSGKLVWSNSLIISTNNIPQHICQRNKGFSEQLCVGVLSFRHPANTTNTYTLCLPVLKSCRKMEYEHFS